MDVNHPHNQKQNSSSYNHSHTATLFLHGYGGSANSEIYGATSCKSWCDQSSHSTAIVDKNGDITFKGKLAKNAINPIVKIELEDNKMVMLSKMQVISKCVN